MSELHFLFKNSKKKQKTLKIPKKDSTVPFTRVYLQSVTVHLHYTDMQLNKVFSHLSSFSDIRKIKTYFCPFFVNLFAFFTFAHHSYCTFKHVHKLPAFTFPLKTKKLKKINKTEKKLTYFAFLI